MCYKISFTFDTRQDAYSSLFCYRGEQVRCLILTVNLLRFGLILGDKALTVSVRSVTQERRTTTGMGNSIFWAAYLN